MKRLLLLVFSLPIFFAGFMNMLTMNYLMKYATDILLVSPAIMALWFFLSRIWDAVNDPIAGYLADKSAFSSGPRKVWITSAILPAALSFAGLWLFPSDVASWGIGVSMLVFFTALTAIYVPHYSLSMNLSRWPDESSQTNRHRVFGYRAFMENFGTITAAVLISIVTTSNNESGTMRNSLWIFLPLFLLAGILFHLLITEQPTARKKSTLSLKDSVMYPFRFREPRLIILAGIGSQAAATFILGSSLYYAQYILLDKGSGGIFTAIFMISATASIPGWVLVLRKFSKAQVWKSCMLALGFGFTALYFYTPFDIWAFYGISFAMGILAGSIIFIHPAMLADSIEHSQKHHDEMRDSSFFSVFTMVNKGAMASAAAAIGMVLDLTGFIPNSSQNQTASAGIRALFTLLPAICFLYCYVMIRTAFRRGN